MDKPNLRNDYESFHQFLNDFCEKLNEKREDIECVPIRQPNPRIRQDELEGETLEWCLNFLSTRGCPEVLAALLAHEVFMRVSNNDLDQYLTDDSRNSSKQQEDKAGTDCNEKNHDTKLDEETVAEYSAEKLHGLVISTLENVCKAWQNSVPDTALHNHILETSYHAIKNTRRKMEDSHVIIQDLNSLYGLQDKPAQSFYGIFDGHAGTEASMFSSKHIHTNLVHKCSLDKNPGEALRTAFKATDDQFIPKAKRERWKSGSTGVAALVRDNQVHMAWLGDSQGVLVKDGRTTSHMEPHKPEKQEERDRIEAEGGFTMLVGECWRVGGNIAVSRAIGDIAYKPFISSEAEVITKELDGTEDYMVLACDGLWDVVTEEELPHLIYNYIVESGGDRSSVAKYLVQHAKDNESMDNISVIVVFFRENISEPKAEAGLFDFVIGGSQGANNSEDGRTEKGDHFDNPEGKGSYSDNQNEKGDNPGKSSKPSESLDTSDFYENDDYYSDDHETERESKTDSFDEDNVDNDDIKENSPEFPESAQMQRLYINVPNADVHEQKDLDYYGVFNTRLVDGPIDLSFMDDPNSSMLLKDIAESVCNRNYVDETEAAHRKNLVHKGTKVRKFADIPTNDQQIPKKMKQKSNHQPQNRKYNKKGFASSPICWAFTGKNKASVQNHRLNQAAKATNKGSHLTPGELLLASKAPPGMLEIKKSKFAQLNSVDNSHITKNTLPLGKPDSLPTLKCKPLAPSVGHSNHSNFTIFGSKSKVQNENQKFHTSWRPRKPLKPISTIVYETPPTPFMQQKISNSKGHLNN